MRPIPTALPYPLWGGNVRRPGLVEAECASAVACPFIASSPPERSQSGTMK
ncbi:hypothetical protein ACIHAX_37415 [Nocardia sp. NPDC051929]|uniref:hypothetical protein n=1 Tax=Nocardia sp. NPDC051929 TaxID=3364327 RepID=UPI0037C70886